MGFSAAQAPNLGDMLFVLTIVLVLGALPAISGALAGWYLRTAAIVGFGSLGTRRLVLLAPSILVLGMLIHAASD